MTPSSPKGPRPRPRRALSARAAKALAGGGFVSAALGLTAALKVAMVPLLTRRLTVEAFSILVLLTSAAPIVRALVVLGCGLAIVRDLPGERDAARRRDLIATALLGTTGVGVAAALLTAAAAALAPPQASVAIRLVGVAVLCWSVADAAREALRGLERYGAFAVCQGAAGLGSMGIIGWLLLGGAPTLPPLAALLMGGALAELGITLAFLRRELGGRPDWATYRRLLGFGAPAAAYFVLRNAAALDRHVIGARSSLGQAGYFQVASTPAGAVELVELALLAAVEPFVYGVAPGELAQVVERLVRRLGLLLLSTATLLALAAPELAAILAPRSYGPVAAVIPCLLFAAAGRSTTRLVTLGAGIARRTTIWVLSAGAYLVLALPGVALVVPGWGIDGAAVVNLAASALTLLLAYVLVRRAWPVTLPAPMLAIAIVGGSVACTLLTSDRVGWLAPPWLRAAAALLMIGLFAIALLLPAHRRCDATVVER